MSELTQLVLNNLDLQVFYMKVSKYKDMGLPITRKNIGIIADDEEVELDDYETDVFLRAMK